MVFAGLLSAGSSASGKPSKPNVLILYADDLGWSDTGCYGSVKNRTPHLDRLASEGMKFTNAYAAAPICSASRASIMTGKSPARLHFEFVSTKGETTGKPLRPPVRTLELPLEETTLGEIAQRAGYRTALFGKWHIAQHKGGYLKWSDTHGPLQQGFETGSDHYGSHPYDKKNETLIDLPEGHFPADALVQKAVDFLQNQQKEKRPFMLFFSSYYVHTPVAPNNSWLIEQCRKRMPGASDDEIKYAVYVETMDHYFGQMLQVLEETGLDKNTLVIFTSDNGGHPAYTNNAPLKGNKWNLYEGGIREPFIVKWPGVVAENTVYAEPVIQWDLLPTLCDLLGQTIPKHVDGESLLPLLKRPAAKKNRQSIYWHFPYYHPAVAYEGTKPCSAIREGSYKLIYFYEDDRSELYDLENDPGEKAELSALAPGVASRLKKSLFEKLYAVHARFPTPNPESCD